MCILTAVSLFSCAPIREEKTGIALGLSALGPSLASAPGSGILCLAVAVSSVDLPFSQETESEGGFGITSSFFSSDTASIELDVPIGSQRLFRVLAYSGETCPLGQNAGNYLRALTPAQLCQSGRRVHQFAHARVDVFGSQTLALTVDEPSGDGV